MADVSIHAPAATPGADRSLFVRALSGLRLLTDAWRKSISYRRTLNELSALSDRELDDLGLTRGQLGAAAYRAVYGA